MGGGARGSFGRTLGSGRNINNPIVNSNRIGSATKKDLYHNFNNIVDNYAGIAKAFVLKGADGKLRTLYQLKGSLNGQKGVFEWIYDKDAGVTHRRFIPGGRITGRPNSK